MKKKKLLYLDIETAPMQVYLWDLKVHGWISPKQIVENGYLLSFSSKWEGQKGMQFHSIKKDGHVQMLRGIRDLLEEADVVVHYNGKKFDMPMLNTEFAKHKLGVLKNPPIQVDLLQVVKRNFKLPSYALDYVCKTFDLGKKVSTGGLELWKGCMKGDVKSWDKMERYNRHDVVLLPRLYKFCLPWLRFTFGYKRIFEWLNGWRQHP